MHSFKKLFLAGAVGASLISNAAAQKTNGTLRGQVVDQLGAVVIGANVTVTGADGVTKTAVSNRDGEFSFSGLPLGTYNVKIAAAEFVPYENAEVQVAANSDEPLVVVMTVGIEQQVVEVNTGNQVSTDPDNNASALVLKGSDLQSLPEDPDELAAALQALAGPGAGPDGGQIYVDGFTGGRLPPREAIREIRINNNPYSAEFERPGFGRVEVLTKPGADKFRGQVFYNFNDEALNSRNPFTINRAPTQTNFYGGNVSGPIKKGKSSFFFDIDNRLVDNNANVNATLIDPFGLPYTFSRAYVVPQRRLSLSPRFDFALNDKNTLIARYNFSRNRSQNLGIGNFSLESRAFAQRNTEHNFQLTETMIITPTAVNETRFQYVINRQNTDGALANPAVNVQSAFIGGDSQVGDNFNKENRLELNNLTTWSIKRHNLKFGGRIRHTDVRNSSQNNFGGTFLFTGIPNAADPQLSVRSIDQFLERVRGNTTTAYLPNQFTINSGNPLADIKQTDFGGFILDDWRIKPTLSVGFGLRYEAQSNVGSNLNFAPRVNFAWSPGAGGARQPKTVFRGGFGVFFDRINDNFFLQEQRFNGVNQIQYTLNTNSGNAAAIALLRQVQFDITGRATNVPTISQIASAVPGAVTVRQVADNIRSPYTINSSIEMDRQLPLGLTMNVGYSNIRGINLLRTRNINAPVCPTNLVCPVSAVRPDPTRNIISYTESSGISRQNEIRLRVNTRFNPAYSLFGFYRLGWNKNDTDGGSPLYNYDLSSEYGYSAADTRHFGVLGASFRAPWNIRVNPFILANSGRAFNITTGTDTNRDNLFTERPTYAQLAAACQSRNLSNNWCDVSEIGDTSQIIPRNYGRGPANFTVNLNVYKTFGFGGSRRSTPAAAGSANASGNSSAGGGRRGGRSSSAGSPSGGHGGMGASFSGSTDRPYNLTFGINTQNLFNRNNRNVPIGEISSPRFGQSVSTAGSFGFFGGRGGGGGDLAAGNRRIDLQVRFSF